MNKSCVNCTIFQVEFAENMCYITVAKGGAEEKANPFRSSTQDAKAGVMSDKTSAFKYAKIPIIKVR